MAVIASWGATQFVVEPHLIKSFSELGISGSCDTEEKELSGQKYVEMKSAKGAEVSMTVEFNALTGHQNVMWEATQFVHMARWGTAYYLYLGNTKLIPAKMMLTKAKISKVVIAPGRGDEWISCSLDLTFQQADADDGTEIAEESGGGGGGGGSTGGGGGGNKTWLQKTGAKILSGLNETAAAEAAAVSGILSKAKAMTKEMQETQATKTKIQGFGGVAVSDSKKETNKNKATNANSQAKKNALKK